MTRLILIDRGALYNQYPELLRFTQDRSFGERCRCRSWSQLRGDWAGWI